MKLPSTPEHHWVATVRRYSAALTSITDIAERTLLRIFKAGERILFHIVVLGGAVYPAYQLLKHH